MIDMLTSFWFLVAVTVIVCSVAATIAQAWQKVRRADQEAALKQEMLRRGLSIEEMERVLRASSRSPDKAPDSTTDKAIEALVACLGENDVSARGIELVLAAVRSADPADKRTICRAVQTVLENSACTGEMKDEQVLAVVRGLQPVARPTAFEDSPPAKPAKADETFQPSRPV